jgi:hypothetical protein
MPRMELAVINLWMFKCYYSFRRALKAAFRLLRDLEHLDRVFNDLIDEFTKSDFKSFWDDFEIFKIILKYGDLI